MAKTTKQSKETKGTPIMVYCGRGKGSISSDLAKLVQWEKDNFNIIGSKEKLILKYVQMGLLSEKKDRPEIFK